jgi:hypothetical protein
MSLTHSGNGESSKNLPEWIEKRSSARESLRRNLFRRILGRKVTEATFFKCRNQNRPGRLILTEIRFSKTKVHSHENQASRPEILCIPPLPHSSAIEADHIGPSLRNHSLPILPHYCLGLPKQMDDARWLRPKLPQRACHPRFRCRANGVCLRCVMARPPRSTEIPTRKTGGCKAKVAANHCFG